MLEKLIKEVRESANRKQEIVIQNIIKFFSKNKKPLKNKNYNVDVDEIGGYGYYVGGYGYYDDGSVSE